MMGPREVILKAIEKKRTEKSEHDRQSLACEHHIKGLEEALKALPKEDSTSAVEPEATLREGSGAALARDYLAKVGHPVHISELVPAIGKENTHQNRVSLASTLATYARAGKIFIKAKPNTFGLIGMRLKGMNLLMDLISDENEESASADDFTDALAGEDANAG